MQQHCKKTGARPKTEKRQKLSPAARVPVQRAPQPEWTRSLAEAGRDIQRRAMVECTHGPRGIVSPSRGVVAPRGWVWPTPSLPPGGLSGRPTLPAAQRRRRRYSSKNFACKAMCANLPRASTDFRKQSPLQAHTSRAVARPPLYGCGGHLNTASAARINRSLLLAGGTDGGGGRVSATLPPTPKSCSRDPVCATAARPHQKIPHHT